MPFVAPFMYSSVYYQYGFYLDSDDETIQIYIDRDVSKTYPLGSVGTFTTKANGRSTMRFSFSKKGTLYQNKKELI